ncbi:MULTISPECIES: DUF4253 domain-containing protein [Streptomyces]|uniref:DUF4253 domain-containing protein n=1 Tax=Streptomyces durocortorensis TaxID=2811104 RepID=A0ABS2HV94_9ACTN|nr:DUF4253 domain-containing protein [Streptomyces durocortorensis]MBM7054954.1 DUF4253 domain-containing protein [Streptomyces durocortorensis]
MATLPNPLPDPAASGLDLPAGSLVDATLDGPWHEPLLWYADGPATPRDWADLRAAGRRLGLLPVLVTGGRRDQWPEDWDLCPDDTSYPGDHDAEEVLAGYWADHVDDADDELGDGAAADDHDEDSPAPGSSWPGLAPVPAQEAAEDADTVAAGLAGVIAADADAWLGGARIALVPARRSADIPAAIGWSGPMNHENDVARLCAVLRSWEDRYDARVVVLGFDTMIVSVGRPPATIEEARALAAEHYAFCPDNIDQSPPHDLDAYAEKAVLNQEAWSFWWD